jgi:hypothetical protein
MMKEEIEDEKIDIETPFLLITDNSPEELNERLAILTVLRIRIRDPVPF